MLQLTLQSVGLQSGEVMGSTVSVNVTRRGVDGTVSTVSDGVEVDDSDMTQRDSRTQSRRGGGAVCVDCGIGVVGGPASAFLSGTDGYVDIAVEVAVGVASPADLAGVVTVGVVTLANAGVIPWPMLGWRPWPMLG